MKDKYKVTLSCRISPTDKHHLEMTAQNSGLSLSQYIENLILDNNQRIRDEQYDKDTIKQYEKDNKALRAELKRLKKAKDKPSLNKEGKTLLKQIAENHPEQSKGDLLTACLMYVAENERKFLKRELTYFINRLPAMESQTNDYDD